MRKGVPHTVRAVGLTTTAVIEPIDFVAHCKNIVVNPDDSSVSTYFVDKFLRGMRARTGPNHDGGGRREIELARAGQLLAEELGRLEGIAMDLEQRRKGDAEKLALARRPRRETTMTLSWIARQLNMGTAGSLENLLRNSREK